MSIVGLFSKEAARKYGTIIWEDAGGKRVEVTGVYNKGEEGDYGWKDKVVVSTCLVKYVGIGQRGEDYDLKKVDKVLDRFYRKGKVDGI